MRIFTFNKIIKLILCFFMIFNILNCAPAPSIMPYDIKLQELYDQLFWSLPEWTGFYYVWEGDYERKDHVRNLRKKIFKYFPEWDNDQKAAILKSKVIKGMNEWQVFAALGAPDKMSDLFDFLSDKKISEKGVEKVLRYRERYLEIIFFNNQVKQIKLDGVDIPVFFIAEE